MASMRKVRAAARRSAKALDTYYERIGVIADIAKAAIDRETEALSRQYPGLAGRARDLAVGLMGLVRL